MPLDLITWAEHYLKARDSFERQLVSLERAEPGLVVTYKKRELKVVGEEKLTIAAASVRGNVLLVTTQTEANFDVLVKEFSKFTAKDDLTIIFANPTTNEKWIIKPSVHAAVADKTNLKAGLTTMFQTVPTI